ncbi:MAG: HEAT repeat domain-containing protein [Elusimicrobia bacterium]|nr:HEAT repeat domain-containing protein [Elusimicrobiota bacterium]
MIEERIQSTILEFSFLSEVERYDAFLRLYHSQEGADRRILAAMLSGRDALVPLIILQYLEDLPEKRAMEGILHLIERGNEVVSRAAMGAYKRSHYPGKPRLLKRLVLSRSDRACRFAVRTLSRAGFMEILPLIIRELPERTGQVQSEMIEGLRFLPDRRAAAALTPLADAKEETVRYLAVEVLSQLQGRVGSLPASFFLKLTHDPSERIRRAALEALHSYPTRKVAELILAQAMDPEEPEESRDRAVRALAGFPSRRWVKPLCALAAASDSPSMRLAVEVALRGYPPEELRAGLLPMLSDPELGPRHQAAVFLAELCGKDPAVRERLLAEWRGADERGAVELVEVLRALGGPEAAAELRAAVKRSRLVAFTAAGALARMRGHGELLLEIVSDDKVSPTVRQAVLSHWAKRGPDEALQGRLTPLLLGSLTSAVINIRYLALQILAWFPLAGKLDALLSVLASEADVEVVATVSKQILHGLGRDPIPLALALTTHPERAGLMGHAVRLLTAQSWDPVLAPVLLDLLREPPLSLLDSRPETYLSVCAHLYSHGAVTLQGIWEGLADDGQRALFLRLLTSFMFDTHRRFPPLPLEFLALRAGAGDPQLRGLWHAMLATDGRVESVSALAAALAREKDPEVGTRGAALMRRFLTKASA